MCASPGSSSADPFHRSTGPTIHAHPATLLSRADSFSASVMFAVFCIISGLNHIYIVLLAMALVWNTMVFGSYSETVNRPRMLGRDAKPKYWRINRTNPHLMWAPMLGPKFNRLWPHLLGYVPCVLRRTA